MEFISSVVDQKRISLKPPEKLSLIEWADRYRQIARKTSATPGQWHTLNQPCAFGPMAAAVEDDTHTVTVMSGTQIVKTEFLLCVAGYHIDQDPAAMLFVQPTQDSAATFSKSRFEPMVDVTPRLSRRIAASRSRHSKNTLTHKEFTGGTLDFVGANSSTDLSSRPIRIVLCDEIDKYPPSAGDEGDPLKLAEERASTYRKVGRARFFRTCSPTTEGVSRIDREYKFSDQRRLFLRCPYCDCEFFPVWGDVRWDRAGGGRHLPDTAGIVCRECGSKWSEGDRENALIALQFETDYGWRQTRKFICCGEEQSPETWSDLGRSACAVCGQLAPYDGHAGFHISKLVSRRHNLAEVVREFLETRGIPENLKKWTNTSLAEVWRDQVGDGIDGTGLAARAEIYGPDDLPSGVEVITGAADVQGDRIEVQLIGWGRDEEAWPFLYQIIHLDPGQASAWIELDSLLKQTFLRRGGMPLTIGAFGIDTGYHATQVYDFCRRRRGRRIYPVKGAPGAGRPIWTPQPRSNRHGDYHWAIGVHAAKDAIYARLKIPPAPDGSRPGCIHFPISDDFGKDYFDQLTSERRVMHSRFGQPFVVYELPPGKRNEALDTFVYAMALRRALPKRIERGLEYSVTGPITAMTGSGLQAVKEAEVEQWTCGRVEPEVRMVKIGGATANKRDYRAQKAARRLPR